MSKTTFNDAFVDKRHPRFDFSGYLYRNGFIQSKLNAMRFYRRDGFNVQLIDGQPMQAAIFNSTYEHTHVATISVPTREEDAETVFKLLSIIKI